ncbi:MAG: hypothetical protein RBU30_23875, partial [Polyangia bacterium]|nr:hypothetical protein [Polyangia bacterium]
MTDLGKLSHVCALVGVRFGRVTLASLVLLGAAGVFLGSGSACGGDSSSGNQNENQNNNNGSQLLCGNGQVEGIEECDDGAQNSDSL